MKYLLIDVANMFHRCRHVVSGDIDIKAGMTLHLLFNSILKCYNKNKFDKIVFAFEGRSWRKEVYQEYKLHREVKNNLKSQSEKEEDQFFYGVMEDFSNFIKNKTNSIHLQSIGLEADDLIALWVEKYKEDYHLIITSDSDFIQLISTNVHIYDGKNEYMITPDGVFNDKNEHVINKKSQKPIIYDPEYELFKKCILGDSSDGILRAAPPRFRETKIVDAYQDRHKKGYDWNNLMLQEWEDHKGEKLTVYKRYEINKSLIDLTQQPDIIKQLGFDVIEKSISKPNITNVGLWLLKFCEKHRLNKISQNIGLYSDLFI
jgi:hypothetical protein